MNKNYCKHADFSSVPHSLICKKNWKFFIRREECNIMITCTMLYGEWALISNRHMQSSSDWVIQDITVLYKCRWLISHFNTSPVRWQDLRPRTRLFT